MRCISLGRTKCDVIEGLDVRCAARRYLRVTLKTCNKTRRRSSGSGSRFLKAAISGF